MTPPLCKAARRVNLNDRTSEILARAFPHLQVGDQVAWHRAAYCYCLIKRSDDPALAI
jgi:hypothetical protein